MSISCGPDLVFLKALFLITQQFIILIIKISIFWSKIVIIQIDLDRYFALNLVHKSGCFGFITSTLQPFVASCSGHGMDHIKAYFAWIWPNCQTMVTSQGRWPFRIKKSASLMHRSASSSFTWLRPGIWLDAASFLLLIPFSWFVWVQKNIECATHSGAWFLLTILKLFCKSG